tara:strand:- start:1126 stop:1671 length:546 start_codon:yes stop_codon:yes gene_type:complete
MSKLLILSAGVSEDSNNTKLAKKLNKYLNEEGIPNEIYENLHENIPFLLDNQEEVPKKILEMRKSLESADKIIIFSPVYNGGFLAHLKNTLDWLSLSYDGYKFNFLFKDKTVGVITSVRGGGGNAQNAFKILSAQLLNYGLRVFEEFHLITNKEHQVDSEIDENQKIFENVSQYINRFLNF